MVPVEDSAFLRFTKIEREHFRPLPSATAGGAAAGLTANYQG